MAEYYRDSGAGGPWTTVSGRSRKPAAPPAAAPAPRRGGDIKAAAGEVAEAVEGMEIGGDGERRLDKYDIAVEVSGEGAPPPVDEFDKAGLAEAVLRSVVRCGYEKPTPIAKDGRDLMACAQTGSGKTAAFCLPVISGLVEAGGGERRDRGSFERRAHPRALIFAPTRELAAQIYEEAKKFSSQTGLRVAVAYGGTPIGDQLFDLERGVDILVATPGRPVYMVERSRFFAEQIKYLVMVEDDRMLDMVFEPQIRKIVARMGMPKRSRQTLLFSATFPPEIQRLASDFMSNYIFITLGRAGSSTDLIEQTIEFANDGCKRSFLLDLLQKQSVGVANSKQPLTLVFVERKREADSLRYWLYSKGFPATAIHGDRTKQVYEEARKFFRQTGPRVAVAYAGAPIADQLFDLERGVDIRLVDMVERSRISIGAIKYLVMDEADRMLDMVFEPQIRKIVDRMGMPKRSRQTLLFSATFPPEIQGNSKWINYAAGSMPSREGQNSGNQNQAGKRDNSKLLKPIVYQKGGTKRSDGDGDDEPNDNRRPQDPNKYSGPNTVTVTVTSVEELNYLNPNDVQLRICRKTTSKMKVDILKEGARRGFQFLKDNQYEKAVAASILQNEASAQHTQPSSAAAAGGEAAGGDPDYAPESDVESENDNWLQFPEYFTEDESDTAVEQAPPAAAVGQENDPDYAFESDEESENDNWLEFPEYFTEDESDMAVEQAPPAAAVGQDNDPDYAVESDEESENDNWLQFPEYFTEDEADTAVEQAEGNGEENWMVQGVEVADADGDEWIMVPEEAEEEEDEDDPDFAVFAEEEEEEEDFWEYIDFMDDLYSSESEISQVGDPDYVPSETENSD